ncbi:MAG: hypothetical protein FWE22_04325 [Firmicutes bacterium]|nr:hypothetical protein [Bacillota bacterium]
MAFIRKFDTTRLDKLTGQEADTYSLLRQDVFEGKVFPAVRAGRIDFYYKGGRLYKFYSTRFERDAKYTNYCADGGRDDYESAKKQKGIAYGRF